MVGVNVSLENSSDMVPFIVNEGDQVVGSVGGDEVLGRIVVQYRVYNNSILGGGVSHYILPSAGLGIKDFMNYWICHCLIEFGMQI